jgi:TolB-like protein
VYNGRALKDGLLALWEGSMASNGGVEHDRGRIREQLDRILSNPEFQAPDRGHRFLQYVVEEALEGRGEQLNAYTIAQAVFGRGVGFDAQSDPVVRIEAGRIRRALERYYLVCGGNDPVTITIPKGHYAPSFEQGGYGAEQLASSGDANRMGLRDRQNDGKLAYRDLLVPIGVPAVFAALAMLALIRPLEQYLLAPATHPPDNALQQTKIVVEPLAMLGGMPDGADIARGLSAQLMSQLTKLDGIVVLDPVVSGRKLPAGSTFTLEGNLTRDTNSLHVQVRLVASADGRAVWARRIDRETAGRSMLDLQDEIGAQIVKDISGLGAIKGGADTP